MILGVIPARGGSKGIPRKNLKLLLGRPLVCWSISAAKHAELLDRFVVSTEDPEIAAVAHAEGAEVLDRPSELATDGATTVSVLQHAIEVLKPSTVVLLQPTSPIRPHGLIDRAISTFRETDADTVATGFITHQYEWGTMENMPRQQMKGWFYDDGNVSVHRTWYLMEGHYFGPKRVPMVVEHCCNHEIDDEWDFIAVEAYMRRLLETGKLAAA